MAIPNTITRDQYTAALRAFWAVLDLDADQFYFPVVLDDNSIVAPAVPASPESSLQRPPAVPSGNSHPQGDEFGEFACMVRIGVERLEAAAGRPLYGDVHVTCGIDYNQLAKSLDEGDRRAKRMASLDGVER